MLDDHPVRVAGGADPLDVRHLARGLVGNPPSAPPEAPAQVDVLDVHEVPVVPAADARQRIASEPDRCARHPIDVARLGWICIELPVAPRERVVGLQEPDEPVTDRVANRRHPTCGRVHRPGGLAHKGSDRGEVGLRVEPGEDGGGRSRATRRSGLHTATTGACVARTPRFAPPE